jgi:MFS transporter, PPP family, 3-phenylpropionic acid transporter
LNCKLIFLLHLRPDNLIVMKQSHIIRILFFLTYAAAASWLSFFNLFLKNYVGLTDGEIGVVIAIQQVNTLLILPVWGIIADRFGRKNILSLTMFLVIFGMYGFIFQKTFISVLVFVYLFTLIYNPISPLLDSVALDFVEQSKKYAYGSFRLWASVGWALSSVVTGTFIDENNSEYIFVISSVLLTVNFLILKFLYKPLKVTKTLKSLKLSQITTVLFSDKRLYILLIIMLFYGIFSSPIHLFINIYYIEIGGGYHHVGYAYLFQAMAEVPFFIFGRKIINRFGARRLILFTMVVTAIRLLAYGVISDPWVAIFIGTTHGISLGLFILSFITFVHQFIAPEYRATGQSFIYAFYFGGGVALGNVFTGYLSENIGMQNTMLVQGALILLLVSITLVIFGALKRIGNYLRKNSA